jgi:alkanesulfonate monooxygenase SsuD/methylene tetrahydromethanopterin reductase-like flavin-dependent oxidoreductase (luciferase family)
MRTGVVVLPIYDRPTTERIWRSVEQMGFDAAYTYDHLSWRTFRGRPWFPALPTLSVAAAVTDRIRLGPLVCTPNFRHPLPFAAEVVGIDHLSDGRLSVGIGAGAPGPDNATLGQRELSPRQRAERFAEFVAVLDPLLRGEAVDHRGAWYQVRDARLTPGCLQTPRAPLSVAATGPRGLRVTAEYAQTWVTYGRARGRTDTDADGSTSVVGAQLCALRAACDAVGRDPATLERAYLAPSPAGPLASLSAFVDAAGRFAEIGMTEFIVHRPVADTVLDADLDVFEGLGNGALETVRRLTPARPD